MTRIPASAPNNLSPAGLWVHRSACIGHEDDMFPDNSEAGIANAKAICGPCPVRDACLADALRTGDNHWGIRGGLKPEERRKLANPDGPQPAKAPVRPENLADAFRARTTRTTDGHLTWHGEVHIKVQGERYTAYQAAFIVGHGREPEGRVRRTCGKDCFRFDHLTDAVIRDSTATCGTRASYLRHRKRGEDCARCRRANTLSKASV